MLCTAVLFLINFPDQYMHKLYLASQSPTRQQLLASTGIPFTVIGHNASEIVESHADPSTYVQSISRQKMEHLSMSLGSPGDIIFVLTADSLCLDAAGIFYAKPADRAEAVAQIKALRGGGKVITAFCLEKRQWQDGWKTIAHHEQAVITEYVLDLPDAWIDVYLDHVPLALQVSGGYTVEGYGAQFCKSMNGSYSGALGLPLSELRSALEKLGFFS
jgi:septum formation protein